jgi:hypothetical protein
MVTLVILAGIVIGIMVAVRNSKNAPVPAQVPTQQANMFRFHWKEYGWGSGMSIIVAFLFMAMGALGVIETLYSAARHLGDRFSGAWFIESVSIVLLGFGLLTRLNSRFYGLGWTAMLLSLISIEATWPVQSPSNAGSERIWGIVLIAYWIVRLCRWVTGKIGQRKHAVKGAASRTAP